MNDTLDALVQITNKVKQINALQHSGLTVPDEDWSELFALQNLCEGKIQQARGDQ